MTARDGRRELFGWGSWLISHYGISVEKALERMTNNWHKYSKNSPEYVCGDYLRTLRPAQVARLKSDIKKLAARKSRV